MHDAGSLGTILGIWAHPDDEVFLSAGLVAAARDAGRRVVVVTATLGKHGTTDATQWAPDRLGRVRGLELAASLAAVGVTEHRQLGHPDGSLARQQQLQAIDELADRGAGAAGHPSSRSDRTCSPDTRTIRPWPPGRARRARLRPRTPAS
ncbi:PIG-L family deacetylase [Occultella glacieicola]|uniref:PIG-L family deacetylase n=1 Tax=Occultella glacieicola TaxID=2518684 RepID=A0ABY2E225_9MICO|nr:PIG-L family deacetylase [Occultella glacieicola]TDE92653.1 PIG-L family deacetylase [Occultella glacieicola]